MKHLRRFNESSQDTKYFVCDRVRCTIDLAYAKEFLEDERGWNNVTMYDNYDDARKELADYILKREIEARIDEAQKYKWSFVSEQRIEDLNQQLKDIEK